MALNLGPKTRLWLGEIGIEDDDTLRKLGAVEVYARLRFQFGAVITRNMLFGLAAAVANIDSRGLSSEYKAELDRQARARVKTEIRDPDQK
jgi:hypothetical protein